jgi:hypothetical protein
MWDKIKKRLGLAPPPWEQRPFEQPRDAQALNQQRRTKRRLKAGLSVGLAVSAGLFLSCQRLLGEQEAPDAGTDAAPPQDASPQDASPQDASPQDAAPQDASPQDASPQDAAPQDAAPSDGGVLGEAPQDVGAPSDVGALVPVEPKKKKRPKVDLREHRKGMPVRDNLLE